MCVCRRPPACARSFGLPGSPPSERPSRQAGLEEPAVAHAAGLASSWNPRAARRPPCCHALGDTTRLQGVASRLLETQERPDQTRRSSARPTHARPRKLCQPTQFCGWWPWASRGPPGVQQPGTEFAPGALPLPLPGCCMIVGRLLVRLEGEALSGRSGPPRLPEGGLRLLERWLALLPRLPGRRRG